MAIFKILKGASSRINFDVTPFTEGYAYFTPDDSGFYIDAKVDENNKRIRINPKSVSVDKILLSSGWEDGKQTVTVSEIDFYERYCKEHPEYENNRAVLAIQNIKHTYSEKLEKHDFA